MTVLGDSMEWYPSLESKYNFPKHFLLRFQHIQRFRCLINIYIYIYEKKQISSNNGVNKEVTNSEVFKILKNMNTLNMKKTLSREIIAKTSKII